MFSAIHIRAFVGSAVRCSENTMPMLAAIRKRLLIAVAVRPCVHTVTMLPTIHVLTLMLIAVKPRGNAAPMRLATMPSALINMTGDSGPPKALFDTIDERAFVGMLARITRHRFEAMQPASGTALPALSVNIGSDTCVDATVFSNGTLRILEPAVLPDAVHDLIERADRGGICGQEPEHGRHARVGCTGRSQLAIRAARVPW